ncbi:MAG: hypothetical protein QME49_01685 [bacterium]|nr:hypothetical protein [bacterium]
MAMNDTLEDLATKDIANVPIGLGAILFACNGISSACFSTLDKIETMMKIEQTSKVIIGTMNTGLLAALAGNFADDLVGRKTANMLSAAILANGFDNVLGEAISLKDAYKNKSMPFTMQINKLITEMTSGTEKTSEMSTKSTKKAPVIESTTTQKKTGYGSYDFLPEPLEMDWEPIGFVEDTVPSFALPVRTKVDFSDMA